MALGTITHQVGTTFTVNGIANAVRSFGRVAAGFTSAVQTMAANARRYFAPILRGLMQIAGFSWAGFTRSAGLAFKGLVGYLGLATLKMKGLTAAAIASSKSIAELMDRIGKDSRRLGLSAEETSTLRFAFEREGIEADEVLPTISEITREFGLIQDQINKQSMDLSKKQASTILDIYKLNAKGDRAGMLELAKGFQDQKMESFAWIDQAVRELEETASGQNNRYNARGNIITPGGRINAMQQLEEMRRKRDEMIKGFGAHGEALFTLQRFGLDVQKAMTPGIESFYAVSDAFRQMTDPAQKLDVAMKLFGEDAGAKMVTILEKGRQGIQDYNKEMERLGGTVTTADTKLGADYSESLQRMMMALQGVRLELARQILPLLIESQSQLTEWLVSNRSWIAESLKTMFIEVRAFLLDIIDIWHGKRGDFRTGWLNTIGPYLLNAIDLAGQLKDQIGLIFSGADSDWQWLNTVRDGFIAIKDFAKDAFRVLTGGQAETYKWLNTAKQKFDEFVVVLQNFWAKLQEAWQIFYGILEKVHEAFATVLGLFSNVDPTVALMVIAFAKLSGVLALAVGGFGLLARAAGVAFGGIAQGASSTAMALQGLRALGPLGAITAAVGVAGTAAYQVMGRSYDRQLGYTTDLVRQQGDRAYEAHDTARHNRLMRLQTQEGQDYRILDQRRKGIDDPYNLTSSEQASMTGESYAKRFGTMAPNPYAIREAQAAEARDRENAALRARPTETVRVELVGPDGQSAQATVDKAFSDLLRENGSARR
jgi:hypothetical protein